MTTIHHTLAAAREVLYELWYDGDTTSINDDYPPPSYAEVMKGSGASANAPAPQGTVFSRRNEMAGLVLDICGVLITVVDRNRNEERYSNTASAADLSVVESAGGGGCGNSGSRGRGGGGKGKDSVDRDGDGVGNDDGVHSSPLLALASRVRELCASLTPPSGRLVGVQGLDKLDNRPNMTIQNLFESNPSRNHNSHVTTHHHPQPPPSSSSRSKTSGLSAFPPPPPSTAAGTATAGAVVTTGFRSTSLLFDRTASAWRGGRVSAKER